MEALKSDNVLCHGCVTFGNKADYLTFWYKITILTFMKIKIVNLFLSFLFVFLMTIEYVSNVLIDENIPPVKVENIVEEERVDKITDSLFYTVGYIFFYRLIKNDDPFCFVNNLHALKIPKLLLKPPIS